MFTYNTDKKEDILKAYNPIKSTFIVDESNYNNLTSGDRLPNGIRMMTLTTVNALNELIDEDLSVIWSDYLNKIKGLIIVNPTTLEPILYTSEELKEKFAPYRVVQNQINVKAKDKIKEDLDENEDEEEQ